jgi:hypothetical protein
MLAAMVDLDRHDRTRALLYDRVPICLILDLAMPDGPHSTELLIQETHPLAGWRQTGA